MRLKDLESIKELKGWLTVTDAAKRMDVSRTYVSELIAMKKIATIRRVGNVLLVKEEEVMRFKRVTPKRIWKTEIAK